MQLLVDIDNYISNNIQPTWYKYSAECSGIIPPVNGRPPVSTQEFISDLSECLKNNKYPTYYKYTDCSGVITPDMPKIPLVKTKPLTLTDTSSLTTSLKIDEPVIDDIATLYAEPDTEIYYVPRDHGTDPEYIDGYNSQNNNDQNNNSQNNNNKQVEYIDKIEYSSYSNASDKDKISNMINRVYRHNDDKYKQACKYILSKFSNETNDDPITSLNKLLDGKNIYNSIEFTYNPILRLIHVKNIDKIITVDDMRKVFTMLY